MPRGERSKSTSARVRDATEPVGPQHRQTLSEHMYRVYADVESEREIVDHQLSELFRKRSGWQGRIWRGPDGEHERFARSCALLAKSSVALLRQSYESM